MKFSLQTALVIAAGASLIIAPQIPLALIAIALLAHEGWCQWINHKAHTKLEPYVRKIELLQEAYEEVKKDLADIKSHTEQVPELQSKVAQLGMQVATRR